MRYCPLCMKDPTVVTSINNEAKSRSIVVSCECRRMAATAYYPAAVRAGMDLDEFALKMRTELMQELDNGSDNRERWIRWGNGNKWKQENS